MNYYCAREIISEDGKPTGKFRFTKRNDDQIWAVGYCSQKNCYHDTQEEANECYRLYLLDTKLKFYPPDLKKEGNYRFCRNCQTLTNGFAEIKMTLIPLCENCQTREIVEKYFKAPEEIISSW